MDNLNIIPSSAGFDYINTANPTVDVNPDRPYVTWLNSSTGEIFVCKDATAGSNVWYGQNGNSVERYIEYLTLDIPLRGNLIDMSSTQSTSSVLTYIEAIYFNGSPEIYFDGDSSKIYVGYKAAQSFGYEDFVIEFSIYAIVGDDTYPAVIANDSGPTSSSEYMIFISTSSETINFKTTTSTIGASITFDTWVDVAFVRVAETVSVFIDGVASGSENVGNNNYNSTKGISLGGEYDDSTHQLKGYIRDIKFYKGTTKDYL